MAKTVQNAKMKSLSRFHNKGKRTRVRLRANVKWNDQKTQDLLQGVLCEISENDGRWGDASPFEKPTGQIFYTIIAEDYPSLHDIPWKLMRSKIKNMRIAYIATSAGGRISNDESRKQKCPYYELLDELFQMRLANYVSQPIIPHFGRSSSDGLSDVSGDLNVSSEYNNFGVKSELSINDGSSDSCNLREDQAPTTERVDLNISQEQPPLNFEAFIALQERQLRLETQRLAFEKEKEQNRVKLIKLEWQQQLRLRRLDLESERTQNLQMERLRLQSKERVEKYKAKFNYLMLNRTAENDAAVDKSVDI